MHSDYNVYYILLELMKRVRKEHDFAAHGMEKQIASSNSAMGFYSRILPSAIKLHRPNLKSPRKLQCTVRVLSRVFPRNNKWMFTAQSLPPLPFLHSPRLATADLTNALTHSPYASLRPSLYASRLSRETTP